MIYNEFKSAASRADSQSNDNVHFLSRHLATPVAFLCYRLGLTPNQITSLFCIVGFFCGVLFYLKMPLVAYLFWRFHIVLDMADGSVARATKTFSKNAKGFDRSNHIIINTTVLMSLLSGVESFIVANALIITFYLYYFFSRNYEINTDSVQYFSVSKNLVKNIFSLEGYILSMAITIWFEANFLTIPIALFYSLTFIGLFFFKLRYRIYG